MEFSELLKCRQSTRQFKSEQISDEQINFILEAAKRAPVGSNLYDNLHITIVQDQEKLLKFCEAAWKRFATELDFEEIAGNAVDVTTYDPTKMNLFYDAPTVFFVSHKKQDLQPGIEWANAASVVNQMHLAATDLGLGSVYMWESLESMRMLPELDHTDLLELPDDFVPLLGLAVGYPQSPIAVSDRQHEISCNRV